MAPNLVMVMKFFREMNVGGDADQERRLRREIANSNERRRMQSINAGFQSLRTLLPHHEGEKLSKVLSGKQLICYYFSRRRRLFIR